LPPPHVIAESYGLPALSASLATTRQSVTVDAGLSVPTERMLMSSRAVNETACAASVSKQSVPPPVTSQVSVVSRSFFISVNVCVPLLTGGSQWTDN